MSVTVSWFAPASPRGIITDYRVSVECGIGQGRCVCVAGRGKSGVCMVTVYGIREVCVWWDVQGRVCVIKGGVEVKEGRHYLSLHGSIK